MSGHIKFNCDQAHTKPRNVLVAIESMAINIRRLLQEKGKRSDRRAWREVDDAVQLARNIEAIASKAANLPAADAIDSVELLDLMVEQLLRELTRVLAS